MAFIPTPNVSEVSPLTAEGPMPNSVGLLPMPGPTPKPNPLPSSLQTPPRPISYPIA